jgi:hypothetical protein
MSADPIIEKIKKLLRMKRGGTPGEIENALALAAKLAREHNIDLASVNPDEDDGQRITHVKDIMGLRIPLEARLAANILVNFFDVQVCLSSPVSRWYAKIKGGFTIVGTAWDIQIARYVFVFLQRHFRYAWNHRANRRLKNRNAFLHGMYLGLASKLREERDKQEKAVVGAGLIRVERALQLRKSYLAKLFPDAKDQDITPDDSEANNSRWAGYLAGQKTEIRCGINGTNPARPALAPPVGQLGFL